MSTNTINKDKAIQAVGELGQLKEALRTNLDIPELTKTLKQFSHLKSTLEEAQLEEHHEDCAKQHIACLKKSLQAAVTLEFATVPVYLSALWSIKDELHPAAKSIREVAQEEMLHMALAANMLASLGEMPQINTAVPSFPGGLPGGVHEGLVVGLVGLNKKALSNFLWIERPIAQVPIAHPYAEDPGKNFDLEQLAKEHPSDETIGEFYEQILIAFKAYAADPKNPPFSTENQVSGPLAWTVIRDIESVERAIKTIQDQGEGSENNPEETEGALSHYYRFLEVYNEEQYKWNPEKKTLEVVGKLEWPDTWPMAEVPAGGYKQEEVSKEVWYNIDKFDDTYTLLLDQLQEAWKSGGQAALVQAYSTMFDLEKYAKPLMQTKLPYGGDATYGPCWRYKPEA